MDSIIIENVKVKYYVDYLILWVVVPKYNIANVVSNKIPNFKTIPFNVEIYT